MYNGPPDGAFSQYFPPVMSTGACRITAFWHVLNSADEPLRSRSARNSGTASKAASSATLMVEGDGKLVASASGSPQRSPVSDSDAAKEANIPAPLTLEDCRPPKMMLRMLLVPQVRQRTPLGDSDAAIEAKVPTTPASDDGSHR